MGSRMIRVGVAWCVGLVLLAAVCVPSQAAVVKFAGLPTTYTPGSPFSFDVVLDGDLSGVDSFYIELHLTASGLGAVAGVDFEFISGSLPTPLTDYVFEADMSGLFDFNFPAPPGNVAAIGLTDFTGSGTGIDLVSGQIFGTVTVQATANAGDLTISIGLIELLNSDDVDIPVDASAAQLIEAEAETVVPEPASLAIWGLGAIFGGVGCRRRWARVSHRRPS